MRKITAVEFVSLDGVAEAPEAWSAPYFKEEMMDIAQAGMDQADAMLLGRRTYQDFAAYWPRQPRGAPFVAGVDTHCDVHVAVALSMIGARVGTTSVPTTNPRRLRGSLRSPPDWASSISAKTPRGTVRAVHLPERLLDLSDLEKVGDARSH